MNKKTRKYSKKTRKYSKKKCIKCIKSKKTHKMYGGVSPTARLNKFRNPTLPYSKQMHSEDISNHNRLSLKLKGVSASPLNVSPILYPQHFEHIDKIRAMDIPRGTYTPPISEVITIGEVQVRDSKGSPKMFPEYKLTPIVSPTSPQHLTEKMGTGNLEYDLGAVKFGILQQINKVPLVYQSLSIYIYFICEHSNLLHKYGTAIIWGDLQDSIIESMSVSSVEALGSRLLLTLDEAQIFQSNCLHIVKEVFYNVGASPRNIERNAANLFNISPVEVSTDSNSLQHVGYNTHPEFNKPPYDFKGKYIEAMNIPGKKGKEYLFVTAHGTIGKELSPEIKLLAAKYLRIIEFNNFNYIVTDTYRSIFLYVNDILRNSADHVMFENTTKGEAKRKEIFKKLCKYYKVNFLEACQVNTSLQLVNITNERILTGQFSDSQIEENHNVTLKSIALMKSCGVFVPIDYSQDPTPYLYKKKLFRRYRDIPFLSNTVNYNLIENLLQYAIANNQILNVLVYSCSPTITADFKISPTVPTTKTGKINSNMKELTNSKIFLSLLSKIIMNILIIFKNYNMIKFLKYDNIIDGETYRVLFNPLSEPDGFYDVYDVLLSMESLNTEFIKLKNVLKISEIGETFSFAIKGKEEIGNELIDPSFFGGLSSEQTKINMERIKIKIYLMYELYSIFYPQIYYIHMLFMNFMTFVQERYLKVKSEEPTTSERMINYDNIVGIFAEFKSYFDSLFDVLLYIKEGLDGKFIKYGRYDQANANYISRNYKLLYDSVSDNLDYDRHEWIGQNIFEDSIINPIEPGEFRPTGRFPYKYAEYPNVDHVKQARQIMNKQTMKQRRGKKSTNKFDDFHISV